jgi:alkanesulfonate monooxygenase SsuD/methylene tetrahydromethanopterin reductase-like flavin-dependent oxidoreductase (luciferase family)
MMNAHPAGAAPEADFAKLRAYAKQEGRDPASIGVEVWVSTGAGDEASWREEFSFWKRAGVTHLTVNSAFERSHHKRIAHIHGRKRSVGSGGSKWMSLNDRGPPLNRRRQCAVRSKITLSFAERGSAI